MADHTQRTETGALLLNAQQLAMILDVSQRTIWRLRDTGRLPRPIRIGGAVRWRRADVEKWIDDGCPAPSSRDNG
jgi:excisionase family DNA binding protein